MWNNLLILGIASVLITGCSSNDPIELGEDSQIDVGVGIDDYNKGENPEDSTNNSEPESPMMAHINLSGTERDIMRSLNEFSYELVRSYAKDSEKVDNFSVSPVSISVFFSMLANATDGEVQQEIFDLLKTNDLQNINSLSGKLMEYLPTETTGASLSIANRFWVANRFTVPESFSATLKEFYNADVVAVDFTKPTTFSAINEWVSQNTNGLIPSLLNGSWENFINLSSVGANAVYFRGLWKSKFDKSLTKKETFSTPNGKKMVDMMHKYLKTDYSVNENFQLVRLPYASSTNYLELYLPKVDCTPEKMADLLTPEMQKYLTSKLDEYEVTLSLPKFETRGGQRDLEEVLKDMGCNKLFGAVYSPMGITEMSAHKFTHQTVIKVDEEGTELAAVTGGIDVTAAGWENNDKPKVVSVTFDRPFMYIVRNQPTGAMLMAGIITNP